MITNLIIIGVVWFFGGIVLALVLCRAISLEPSEHHRNSSHNSGDQFSDHAGFDHHHDNGNAA